MTKQEYEQRCADVVRMPAHEDREEAWHNLDMEYIASIEAKIELMYETYMTANHEFGLVWKYANEIHNLKADNAKLREDNASLIEQVNAAGVKYEKLIDRLINNVCPHDRCDKTDLSHSCSTCWHNWLEGVKDE